MWSVLALYAETVESMHEQCWVCMVCMVCVVYDLYGMLEFMLCCEILLLLNMLRGGGEVKGKMHGL